MVAGSAVTDDSCDFALVRYHPTGSLDETFGSGGSVRTDFGADECAASLAIQSDGKVLVAGTLTMNAGADFLIARYDAVGGLDPSFGTAGKATTDFWGRLDRAVSLSLRVDGTFLVAGFAVVGTASDVAILAEQMLYTKQMFQERVAEHTGRTIEEIERDSDRDRWFTAAEAKDYGFIDHVVKRVADVPAEAN